MILVCITCNGMFCDRANSNVVTKQNKFNIMSSFQARGTWWPASDAGGGPGCRDQDGRERGKEGSKESFHHVLLHISTPHFNKQNFM